MATDHLDPHYAARKSLESRGYPYYGELRYQYPQHFQSFLNMHNRCKWKNLKTDFPRTREGFIEFIEYLGPGMTKPTVGRGDHSHGYVRGNFKWQSSFDNTSEMSIRNKGNGNLP